MADLTASAVVLAEPGRLELRRLELSRPGAGDVVVQIDFSGISTGTERLLWTGTMPSFPGMGYPLVPGYESVGRVIEAGAETGRRVGELVFVPGANCYGEVRGLFGGAASLVVVPAQRVLPIDERLHEQGTLLALAATAYNAIRAPEGGLRVPELIIGHGVLGRLVARLALLLGDRPPVVWEQDPLRRSGHEPYTLSTADEDSRKDYRVICDVSGADGLLDALIARLAPGGEVVLAGFYSEPLSFAFPPAFMRRARLRVAAEWQHADLAAVHELVQDGRLSLEGLITHRHPAEQARQAYRTAFNDPACLIMLLDWRSTR